MAVDPNSCDVYLLNVYALHRIITSEEKINLMKMLKSEDKQDRILAEALIDKYYKRYLEIHFEMDKVLKAGDEQL